MPFGAQNGPQNSPFGLPLHHFCHPKSIRKSMSFLDVEKVVHGRENVSFWVPETLIFALKTNTKINISLFRKNAYRSRGVQKLKIISLIETRLRAATAFSSRRNCTLSFFQHLYGESVTFVSKLPRNSPSRPSLREPLEISKFSMVKK